MEMPTHDFLSYNPFNNKKLTGVHKNASIFFGKRKDWVGKEIVDLSCGEGISTHILRKLGAKVSHYDLIPEACLLDDKPTYADVQKPLPIQDNSVDVVIFQEVIEHLPNQLFAFQEIYRILKPGGELFITTPSRSSLQGRLAYLVFESENIKFGPWNYIEGVWGQNAAGEKYFGHLFLTGIQQMNTLAKVVGFKNTVVHKNELSKTSVFLLPFLYPIIWLNSKRALSRQMRKFPNNELFKEEVVKQYKLNLSMNVLLTRFMFASFFK